MDYTTKLSILLVLSLCSILLIGGIVWIVLRQRDANTLPWENIIPSGGSGGGNTQPVAPINPNMQPTKKSYPLSIISITFDLFGNPTFDGQQISDTGAPPISSRQAILNVISIDFGNADFNKKFFSAIKANPVIQLAHSTGSKWNFAFKSPSLEKAFQGWSKLNTWPGYKLVGSLIEI